MGRFSLKFNASRLQAGKKWSPPNFDRDNVRLVVIVQNQNTGGRVLFDSKSEPRTAPTNPKDAKKRHMSNSKCATANLLRAIRSKAKQEPTAPCREKRARLASDIKILEEMMFGSAPIIPKGSSLKIHTTKNPPQLMVTKLFLPTDTDKDSNSEQESFDLYSIQSVSIESIPKQIIGSVERSPLSLAHSVPVDVPMHSKYGSEENEDSGFSASLVSSGSSSFTTSGYSPSSSASFNSLNSRTRRLLRNQTTSLDHTVNKRFSDDGEPLPARKYPSRLGIGLTFSLPQEDTERFRHFESFFFSHVTLIESHVVKLKVAVEKALQLKNKHMVLEALDAFRNAVYDLYTAPRLTEPVWLNMMQYSTRQVALSRGFLKDFISCIDKYDTKNNKFFMSTVITAVLTHHLAWVPTVTPAGASPARTYLDKHSAKWLNALARSHPYNPLWAQLGDLYGAIGFPLRLSRTVVVGQKADSVCKLLQVLSYFIRCSEVQENHESRESLDYIDGHMDIPGSAMRTIEEDDLSECGEAVSYGKAFGSATSLSTIRNVVLQTSTETILSARSDRTVIEQTQDIKKAVSFSEDLSVPCVYVDGTPVVYSGAASRPCICQKTSEPVETDMFCPQCRLTRTVPGAHSQDWSYGPSVFYCCQDSLDTNGERTCQCNFDVVMDTTGLWPSPENVCSSAEVVCEVVGSNSQTVSQSCDSDIHRDISAVIDKQPVMQVKALKLFRMLSEELMEGDELGEKDICESSFCDNINAAEPNCILNSADKAAFNTTSFASVSLLRAGQDDLFSLHAPSDKYLTTIQECSTDNNLDEGYSTIEACNQPSSVQEEDVSQRCTLSQCEAEQRVRVDRVRHVGRVSSSHVDIDIGQLHGADVSDLKTSANSELAPVNISNISKPASKFPPISESIESPLLAQNLPERPKAATVSGSIKTREPETDFLLPYSKHSQKNNQNEATEHAESLITCTQPSKSSLYPGAQLRNETDVQKVTEMQNVKSTEDTHINSRSSMEEELLRNPSLLEEPGSIKLIKRDLGTLYPVISGNTVISSLSSGPKDRCLSAVSLNTGFSVSSYGAGLDTIKDTEDEVFLPTTETEIQHDQDSETRALFFIPDTDHLRAGGTPDHVSNGECCNVVESTKNETCVGDLSKMELSDEELMDCRPRERSPSHEKVTAWLGRQDQHPQVSCTGDTENTADNLLEQAANLNVDCEGRASREEAPILLGKDACQTLSMATVRFLGRGNSMFDEYFVDDSVELPHPVELEQKARTFVTGCDHSHKAVVHATSVSDLSIAPKPVCSHNIPPVVNGLPGRAKVPMTLPLPGNLHMLDEHFTGDTNALTLPECPSKEMVTSALSLMQERSVSDTGDDVNLEGLVESHAESRSRSNSEGSGTRSRPPVIDRQLSAGSVLSRQNSFGAGTPARCRAVTPTELGRRRHTSSASNISWDLDSPEAKNNLKEIPMPRMIEDEDVDDAGMYELNFGHSLMAGYTDHYMSDFVLHGTSDNNFLSKLHTDLTIAVQNSVLGEEIAQACCIVADIDKCTVRLHACQKSSADRVKPSIELTASHIVSDVLESLHKLWKLKMSPEFCLMHLEDRLQEIYFKSKVLSEYILIHRRIDHKELANMLELDVSDLPLLLAVAGTHTPTLALAFAS